MNIAVRADDERCIEMVASGLPLFHGALVAVDITEIRVSSPVL